MNLGTWKMFIPIKEKTYETSFMGELRLLTKQLFAPDQCDENFLGFDGSGFIDANLMFKFLPYIRWSRRRKHTGIKISEIEYLNEKLNERLPRFRLNLFIQFKRSEYLRRANAAEWGNWQGEYFRYTIESEQQELMNNILDISMGRAASVYAAGAFKSANEYWNYLENGTVIENSNIISSACLRGHKKYSFSKAGNYGLAHSDPERVSSISLAKIIDDASQNQELSFIEHIKNTEKIILTCLEGEKKQRERLNLVKRALFHNKGDDYLIYEELPWISSMMTITAFSVAFETRVCCIG